MALVLLYQFMKDSPIEIRPIKNQTELKAAFRVRELVFVHEQKIFEKSDRDEWDETAIHLVAIFNQQVVGTVRIYLDEQENWIGSRLAVLSQFRNGVGAKLVRAAEAEVISRGGNKIEALVQAPNVRWFERQGWHRISKAFLYHGRLHYRMEKKLVRKEEEKLCASMEKLPSSPVPPLGLAER